MEKCSTIKSKYPEVNKRVLVSQYGKETVISKLVKASEEYADFVWQDDDDTTHTVSDTDIWRKIPRLRYL